MFKEYLNSYVVFKKINPYALTWGEIFLDPSIRQEFLSSLCRNTPFFALCGMDVLLRGVAQVYLCNHPISGLLMSMALYVTAPQLLVFALMGCLGSTLSSHLICRESWNNIQNGLCG